MRKYLSAAAPFLVALALRLYPTLMTGLPYSSDAWSPISNTQRLLQYTPHHLGDDEVFDGYNNYWPANSLFGAVLCQVTGLQPMRCMAICIPLTGAIAILMFYALVKRLSNSRTSFFASMIFATAYPHAVFTAGVTKETYANPMYIMAMLAFLHPTMSTTKRTIIFSLSSLTLVMAHHYTTLVAATILFSIALLELVKNVREGHRSRRFGFLLFSILVATASLYNGLYGYRGFTYAVTYSEWLSAASFQIIALALTIYSLIKPKFKTILTSLLALTVSVLMLLAMRLPLVFGASVPPSPYLFVCMPLILALSLAICGYEHQEGKGLKMAPLSWLGCTAAIEYYSVFSNSSIGVALASRTSNFFWPPLGILSAVGLHRLWNMSLRMRQPRLIKLLAVTTFSSIIVLNTYGAYAAVSLQDRYMFPAWLYKTTEYEAAAWTATAVGSQTVAGDIKVYQLLEYFGANVDTFQGLRYLMGKGSKPPVLFIYNQMFKNGYIFYDRVIDMPENYWEKVYGLNLVCSNGLTSIHAR